MGWFAVTFAICVVVLCVLPFVALYARRRWLTGQGGLFDCAYRAFEGAAGSGWVLGLARYRADQLEWYRAFSFGLRPTLRFPRSRMVYENQRLPIELESVVLFDDSRIVTLRDRVSGNSYLLAMERDSVMGLMSWLESAPPGSHYLPSSGDSQR